MNDPIKFISLELSHEVVDLSLLTEDEITDALYAKFSPQMPTVLKAIDLENTQEFGLLVIDRLKNLDPTPNKIYVGWLLKQLKFKNIRIAILQGDNEEDEDRIRTALNLFEQAKAIPALTFKIEDGIVPAIPIPQLGTAEINGQQIPLTSKEVPKKFLKPFIPPAASQEQRQQIQVVWENERQQWLATHTWSPTLKKLDPDINNYKTLSDLESLIDILKGVEFKTEKTKERERALELKKGVRELLESQNYYILQCFTPEAAAHYAKMTKWCTSNPVVANDYMNDHGGSLLIIFKKDGDKLTKFGQATADLTQIQDVLDLKLVIDDELRGLLAKVAEQLIKKASTAFEVFGLINAGILNRFKVDPEAISGMIDKVIVSCAEQDPQEAFGIKSPIRMTQKQAKQLYDIIVSKQKKGIEYDSNKSMVPIGSPEALAIASGIMIASTENPDAIYALMLDYSNKTYGSVEKALEESNTLVEALLINKNTPYNLIIMIYRYGLSGEPDTFSRTQMYELSYRATLHPSVPQEDKSDMLMNIWNIESAKYIKASSKRNLQTLIDLLSGAESAKLLPSDTVYSFLKGVSSRNASKLFNSADDKKKAFKEMVESNNFSKQHALSMSEIPEISDMDVNTIDQWLSYASQKNLDASGLHIMKSRKEVESKLTTRKTIPANAWKSLNPKVQELLNKKWGIQPQ